MTTTAPSEYAASMTSALYRALTDQAPGAMVPQDQRASMKEQIMSIYEPGNNSFSNLIEGAMSESGVDFGERTAEQQSLMGALLDQYRGMGFSVGTPEINDGSYTLNLTYKGRSIQAGIESIRHFSDTNGRYPSSDASGFRTRLETIKDIIDHQPSVETVSFTNTKPNVDFYTSQSMDPFDRGDTPGMSGGHIILNEGNLVNEAYREAFRVYTALHGRTEAFRNTVRINHDGNTIIQASTGQDDLGYDIGRIGINFGDSRDWSAGEIRERVQEKVSARDGEMLTADED